MIYTQKHINQMIKAIRKNGITIRFQKKHPFKSKSNCYAINPSIKLGIKGPKWAVLIALSHEYGHCLSVRQGTKLTQGTGMLCRSMGIILSKKDIVLLIEEERIAWNLGFKALRANGITVDEDLQRFRRILFKSETGRYPTMIPR